MARPPRRRDLRQQERERALTTPPEHFRHSYAFAFRRYVETPNETLLRAAYELGRDAVRGELSVLALAEAHHDAMLSALRQRDGIDPQIVVGAGRDFLLESLSSYEMLERAAADAQHAAAAERRQAEMVRRLSELLAQTSVAESTTSLHEVLRLVAEQARELVAAETCVVRVAAADLPAVEEGAFESEGWDTQEWNEPAPEPSGRRLHAVAEDDGPRGNRLTAPLQTLTGDEVGAIEAARRAPAFTQLDEALLVHLARMTSAAVERALLLERRRA